MRWDLYCRVIDNLGDAGVCWRLAADLAARGETVRLCIDDAAPLRRIAPGGAPGVQVCGWPDAPPDPGDVVIEAFGCDPPAAVVERMAAMPRPPLWLNLEYLSAEPYVERSHGLPSPQPNGLVKWFFYPGFTPRTGGLLREPGLLPARAGFERRAWLREAGIVHHADERLVTLFCYDNPALPALLQDLAQAPTLLLATPGAAQAQLAALPLPPGLRVHALPWLPQAGFDRLLWAADLNLVRGEDSLVRALWAGAPLVWQAYVQHDGAHHAKVDALLARLQVPPAWAALWRAWNGSLAAWPGLPAFTPAPQRTWPGLAEARAALLAQPDLVTQLLRFVETRRTATPAG